MSKKSLCEVANIITGKLDANAAETTGKYPFFTCGEKPSSISYYAYDLDAIILAGNNAQGNFHIQRYNGKFNAYQGWLAFNMLKNRLKRRRKIKDELYIVSQLGECKINSAMIEEIKSSMSTLDGRIYRPRKLKELFERT